MVNVDDVFLNFKKFYEHNCDSVVKVLGIDNIGTPNNVNALLVTNLSANSYSFCNLQKKLSFVVNFVGNKEIWHRRKGHVLIRKKILAKVNIFI